MLPISLINSSIHYCPCCYNGTRTSNHYFGPVLDELPGLGDTASEDWDDNPLAVDPLEEDGHVVLLFPDKLEEGV